MRDPEPALTPHKLQQRMHEVWKVLAGRHGQVADASHEALRDGRRRIEFQVEVPGYGLPVQATMVFVEHWRKTRGAWTRGEYAYDHHAEPRPSGRKAHHRHELQGRDQVVHAHCEDPRPAYDHYRDVPVTLLEAAEEFALIHASGTVACRGLFPLLD